MKVFEKLDPAQATDQELIDLALDHLFLCEQCAGDWDHQTTLAWLRLSPSVHSGRVNSSLRDTAPSRSCWAPKPARYEESLAWDEGTKAWITDALRGGYGIALLVRHGEDGFEVYASFANLDEIRWSVTRMAAHHWREAVETDAVNKERLFRNPKKKNNEELETAWLEGENA